MELLDTKSVRDVLKEVKESFRDLPVDSEILFIEKARGRILAEDIVSKENIPEFNRSTVDGYGVYHRDTSGASDALPTYLQLKFSVEMGKEAKGTIRPGECCYIPTGGVIPEGVDSVVMVEYTEEFDEETIGMKSSVAHLENVLEKGEDIRQGEKVFTEGHRLRSQDIGLLAGLGIEKVRVYERMKVGILSTGDEIVEIHQQPGIGEVRDMNRFSLMAALDRDGFLPVNGGIISDEKEQLQKKLKSLLEECHLVLLSGGSSMGEKDYTKEVINGLGEPGVFIHGVSMKPGKPTIIGKVEGKAVIGLPGQPVSALMVYEVLVKGIGNIKDRNPRKEPYIIGEMDRNFPSAAGRSHYFMVEMYKEDGKTKVTPVYGKSGTLSMMGKAFGYVVIPHNDEGLNKGEKVMVYPLR